MLAAPAAFSAPQIETLFGRRGPKQAFCLWSERRYHPAHRLVCGLVDSDEQAWRIRYVRQTTQLADRPAGAVLRWRALESLGVILGYANSAPLKVAAAGTESARRGCIDQESLVLTFEDIDAYVQVSLGEAIERRETVVAAADRKAYIDELNPSVPVRLIDDEPLADARAPARWVSCPSPDASELARQQCLAFLEATQRPAQAEAEAALWSRALATWRAAEASLASGGAPAPVTELAPGRFQVLPGGARPAPSGGSAPILRVVFGR